jgi:DNA-binding beta-propeller fold protein YncE
VAANNFEGVLFLNNRGRLMEIISPEEEGKKVMINNVMLDRADKLYMVSEDQGRIYIYDQERQFIMKFGEKGGSSGKLSRPRAVGVDDVKRRMYVVDYMRHTINVYNEEGAFIFEFGGRGWGKGWFYNPNDITIDSEGRILVADLFNHRVQVFHSW